MSDFPAQTRQILEKVVQGKLSKIEASEKLGVSRKTIYQWLKKYSDWKPDSTPTKRKRLQKNILRIVMANPEYGPRKISWELEKAGEKLSERSVWKLLRELGIATVNKRKVYIQRYRQPSYLQKEIVPGHLRLNAESRKRMVEEVVLVKRPVKDVTVEYGVSRKTFAKWKRRYVLAQTDRKNILLALSDQNPKGSRHPRGISERMEQAVLDLVSTEPELSSHKIAKKLKHIGNHGVQKVLERLQLSTQEARLAYVRTQKIPSKPIFVRILDRVLLVWEQFMPSLAPAPPPLLKLRRLGPLLSSTIIAAAFAFIIFSGIRLLIKVSPYKGMPQSGLVLATVALTMGSVFFLYSLKYYLTLAIVLSFSQQEMTGGDKGDNGKRRGFLSWILGLADGGSSLSSKARRSKVVGLEPSLEHIVLKKHPVISVHIPLYNEKKVVERALRAASSFDYPQYEVIFADDSTDETTTIINKYQKSFGRIKTKRGDGWVLKTIEIRPGVIFKHLHRTSRSGFKGGALKKALEHTDKKAEFIAIFDADFVPYPDTLELFLKYFKVQNNMSEDYKESDVAAVQGYQWHVLNKSENWITRGVRTEYAGSYVVERSGSEIIDSIKQISGSAYCIRRDLLDEIGWGTSITEDFELTLKLYEKGYRVVYTPYVQAPAECVSTMKDLIRQRMRWAEGHSNNIKKMFTRLLFKSSLKPIEKLEFLYLSPYYLQAFFFLIGTICWILTETIYPGRLPFWTSLWGWSMVLTNFLSLPLMNAVGLFLEESEEKDYVGLASFIALSYLLVPFLAYASLKGFLEREEGPWFRTPKTGRITDIFTRGKFYRFISGVLPGFRPASIIREAAPAHLNQYLALATANNQFNSFNIRPRRKRWLGKVVLSLLLAFTVTVYSATRGVPEILATATTNKIL
ncbi:glycosyltransferase, partial [Candidatus Woesebacteria bacterium]